MLSNKSTVNPVPREEARVVPWTDVDEWNQVKNQVLSSHLKDFNKAYRAILLWKVRSDNVPAYVEVTAGILQVLLHDHEPVKYPESLPLSNQNNLRLYYSMALIRFVNHVASVSNYRGYSLYQAATYQKIPDWIINLRHDAAHSQELPDLDSLRAAAEFTFNWILENYWKNAEPPSFNRKLLDVDVNVSCGRLHIETIISAFDILCRNIHTKYFQPLNHEQMEDFEKIRICFEVQEESQAIIPNYFIEKLEEMLQIWRENSDAETKIKGTKVKTVKQFLLDLLEIIVSGVPYASEILPEVILTKSSFLSNENRKNWSGMIYLTQRIKGFTKFLKLLFILLGKGEKLAGDWLMVLLPSIRSLNNKWLIFKELKKGPSDFHRDVKMLAVKSDPKSYPGLIIPLEMTKPPIIDLEMLKPALINPATSYDVVTNYLEFVKQGDALAYKKILYLLQLNKTAQTRKITKDVQRDQPFTWVDVYTNAQGSTWKLSELGSLNWKECPIGLMPGQEKVKCDLPENLEWEEVPIQINGKRKAPLRNHLLSVKKR